MQTSALLGLSNLSFCHFLNRSGAGWERAVWLQLTAAEIRIGISTQFLSYLIAASGVCNRHATISFRFLLLWILSPTDGWLVTTWPGVVALCLLHCSVDSRSVVSLPSLSLSRDQSVIRLSPNKHQTFLRKPRQHSSQHSRIMNIFQNSDDDDKFCNYGSFNCLSTN